jgi:predicted transcriptional regulator
MQSQKAIEILDNLLEYFAQADEQYILLGKISNHFNMNMTSANEIVDQLILDGYLKAVGNESNIPVTKTLLGSDFMYSITFSGRLFYEKGGYKEQRHKEELDQVMQEQKERIALRNERLLVKGTWAAAIVGLLVLGWQVATYFYSK